MPTNAKARMEFSAGGVVYRRAKNGDFEIAFIHDQSKKWTFAKGHIEPGETNASAAKRETEEEMGLRDIEEKAFLGTIDFWFRDRYNTPGALIKKRVYYFLFEAKGDTRGVPQREEKITAVKCVPIDKALETIDFENTKVVLERAIEFLKKLL